jgi:threonine synthase
MISKIKEWGIKKVLEDSSGNAGASVAAYCALADIDCEIFVPEKTPPAKCTQIRAYGARLKKIPGNRESVTRSILKKVDRIFYASHIWNPFFLQGTKTIAFEFCEQLDWIAPDAVVLPVGNGSLILGCFIGFSELYKAQVISKIPKLIAVQAENCAPLYRIFNDIQNGKSPFQTQSTIAEGIAIANPLRGLQIIEAVKETKGNLITVNESSIIRSLKSMGQKGYFVEPTSAATIAGLNHYIKTTGRDETIVSILTGYGLKASDRIADLI